MTSYRTRLASCAAALVVLGSLASCGDGDEPTEPIASVPSSTAPASADDLPPAAEVEAYFAAVASFDPARLEQAESSTEPGSVAATYAGYLRALSSAAIDAGNPEDGFEIEPVDGGGFTSCRGDGPDDCVVWSDFRGRDGKLVDFTIDDQELDSRIAAGDGTTVPAGTLGDVELASAYQSVQSDDLFVVVEVTGDQDVSILSDRATYRTADEEEVTALRYVGPTGTEADGTATVVIVFPQVGIGGVVTLELVGPDQHSESVELTTG